MVLCRPKLVVEAYAALVKLTIGVTRTGTTVRVRSDRRQLQLHAGLRAATLQCCVASQTTRWTAWTTYCDAYLRVSQQLQDCVWKQAVERVIGAVGGRDATIAPATVAAALNNNATRRPATARECFLHWELGRRTYATTG